MKLKSLFPLSYQLRDPQSKPNFTFCQATAYQIKLMHMGAEAGTDPQLFRISLNVFRTPQERRVDTVIRWVLAQQWVEPKCLSKDH